MLGSSRREALARIKFSNLDAKEAHPVWAVIAAPRQGKSLFLDEVAAKLQKEYPKKCVVSISFNSKTQYEAVGNATVELFQSEFWGRVIFTLLRDFECIEDRFEDFHSEKFFRRMDSAKAKHAARKLGCGDEFIIVADEFSSLFDHLLKESDDPNETASQKSEKRRVALSKLTTPIYNGSGLLILSGFQAEFGSRFGSVSRRPVNFVHLPMATQSSRHEYEQLKTALQKEYERLRAKLPTALYEWTKFSPGLLGLWLEKMKEDSTLLAVADNLSPPFTESLHGAEFGERVAQYWRHVANANSTDEAMTLLGDLEKRAMYLHHSISPGRGFLNPFILARSASLDSLTSHNQMIRKLRDKFQAPNWTRKEKGKVLEQAVLLALSLRLAYTAEGTTLSKFIENTCGAAPAHLTFGTYDDENVTLCLDGSYEKVTKLQMFPRAAESRREENISFLCGPKTGTFSMQASNNAGCDLGVKLHVRDLRVAAGPPQTVLLLFETRYHSSADNSDIDKAAVSNRSKDRPNDPSQGPSKKAWLCLDGLLKQDQGGKCYIKEGNIRRVALAYCISNKSAVDFDMEYKPNRESPRLAELCEQVRDLGCTLSLHAVNNDVAADDNVWRSLLMQSLYYVVPDMDVDAENFSFKEERSDHAVAVKSEEQS